MSPAQARRIGGYTLVEPLGSGGSGTVWRAIPDAGGSPVAFKLLHLSGADSELERKQLLKETRLVNAIRLPSDLPGGVAHVIDVETDGVYAFIVSELIPGPTLAQKLENGPLTQEQVLELGHSLAAVLEYVHAAKIAHRDLKPSNVILSAKGPVLIDFGIARADGGERVTQTGLVRGTPGFVSPEVLQGRATTFEAWVGADWYAFAALLLQALTGRPPFGAGQMALWRQLRVQVDTNGLSEPLQNWFRAALAVDPNERVEYPDLLAAIEADLRDDWAEDPTEVTDALDAKHAVDVADRINVVDEVGAIMGAINGVSGGANGVGGADSLGGTNGADGTNELDGANETGVTNGTEIANWDETTLRDNPTHPRSVGVAYSAAYINAQDEQETRFLSPYSEEPTQLVQAADRTLYLPENSPENNNNLGNLRAGLGNPNIGGNTKNLGHSNNLNNNSSNLNGSNLGAAGVDFTPTVTLAEPITDQTTVLPPSFLPNTDYGYSASNSDPIPVGATPVASSKRFGARSASSQPTSSQTANPREADSVFGSPGSAATTSSSAQANPLGDRDNLRENAAAKPRLRDVKRIHFIPTALFCALISLLPVAFEVTGWALSALVAAVFFAIGISYSWRWRKVRLGQEPGEANPVTFPVRMVCGLVALIPGAALGSIVVKGVEFVIQVINGRSPSNFQLQQLWDFLLLQTGSSIGSVVSSDNMVVYWVACWFMTFAAVMFPTANSVRKGLGVVVDRFCPDQFQKFLVWILLAVVAVLAVILTLGVSFG